MAEEGAGGVIGSSYTLRVNGTSLSYQLVEAGTVQLQRHGFYLPANIDRPVPHISLQPYGSGEFSIPELVIGDLWFDTDGFHFYDGTNIGTIVTSGSVIVSPPSPSASYAGVTDSGSVNFISNTDASLLIYMYSNFI